MKKISFTSASTFPAKLLKRNVIDSIGIMPVHLQISPTNRCTLSCSFCSCSARELKLQLSLEDIKEIINSASECGTKAVTITGGGEPLCHPQIKEIISHIGGLGIKIGLVTNGTIVHVLDEESWSKITWCRISSADFRGKDWNEKYQKRLQDAVDKGPNVDWAFSHVMGRMPNIALIKKLMLFANKNNFTHIRIVSDLLDLDNVPSMKSIEAQLKGMDYPHMVYQGRKDSTPGAKRCLISLLKPVVGTNGMLYPCCGTQYAQEIPSKDFGEPIMSMGNAKDIKKIYESQSNFDGSICKTCFYSDYNWALDVMTSELKHEDWV